MLSELWKGPIGSKPPSGSFSGWADVSVLRVSPSVFLARIWSSHLPFPPPNTILEASTSRMTDWGFGNRALRSSGKINHPRVSTLANRNLQDDYYSHSKTTTQKWTEEEDNPLCFQWHGNCMIPRLKTTGKEGERWKIIISFSVRVLFEVLDFRVYRNYFTAFS